MIPHPSKGLSANVTLPTRSIRLALAAAFTAGALLPTSFATRTLAEPGADAIFAIGEGGFLAPIAVRKNGTFINPGSNDGGPSESLAKASIAAVASAGNHVHVLFGGRVIATVPATIDSTAEHGAPRAPLDTEAIWTL